MRKFKELEVWQIGFHLLLSVYQVSKQLPSEEKYALGDQIRRAVISIPSNISEGCSRSSDKEFKRYLEIALGSAFELETQLLAIKELNMVSDEKHLPFDELNVLQKKLNALISSVKSRIE